MRTIDPIITIYGTFRPTLPGGPNPSNNSEVYNSFANCILAPQKIVIRIFEMDTQNNVEF